jgi:hypothetical protein
MFSLFLGPYKEFGMHRCRFSNDNIITRRAKCPFVMIGVEALCWLDDAIFFFL